MRYLFSTLFFLSLFNLQAQDKPAYQLFDAEGSAVKYKKLLKAVQEADVVLFGELHNNPVVHWLQFELCKDMYRQLDSSLIVGGEMWEADGQLMIDELAQGIISLSAYEKEMRLWPNYATDYKPIFDFAIDKKLRFVATNVPRRYASLVYKSGFEGLTQLSPPAQSYLAPLPIDYDAELPGYKAMLNMSAGMGGHANPNLPKAQAVKDATMAHHIQAAIAHGGTFLHLNGTYHSNNYEGIVWYLQKTRPNLKIITIASVEQDDIEKLTEENQKLADFIVCVPQSMTKTH